VCIVPVAFGRCTLPRQSANCAKCGSPHLAASLLPASSRESTRQVARLPFLTRAAHRPAGVGDRACSFRVHQSMPRPIKKALAGSETIGGQLKDNKRTTELLSLPRHVPRALHDNTPHAHVAHVQHVTCTPCTTCTCACTCAHVQHKRSTRISIVFLICDLARFGSKRPMPRGSGDLEGTQRTQPPHRRPP
jgi:hypothetical protein